MITPISLEQDVEVIGSQLALARSVGAKRFHIDIIDGLFADNITVTPADLQALDMGGLEIDLHLLVDDPVEWIEESVAIGPKRVFAQIERMGNIEYYIKTLKEYGGVSAGVALDIDTPIESLSLEVLKESEAILLMSVKAGYSGQTFDERVLLRIRKLRERYAGPIVIDGGIDLETYEQVMAAGASEAGANSALWKGDFEANFKKFMEVESRWQKK